MHETPRAPTADTEHLDIAPRFQGIDDRQRSPPAG